MNFIKKILISWGIIKDKIEEEFEELVDDIKEDVAEAIDEIQEAIEEEVRELAEMSKAELKKKVRELGLDKDIDLRQSKEDIAKAVVKLK